MNRKGYGKKGSWPMLRYHPGIFLAAESHKKPVRIAGLEAES
jgi:hypothetical protein